jgi:RNA-directed DNA polymerase
MFRHRLNKLNSTVILYRNCDELKKDFYSLKTSRDVARILDISYDRLIYHIHKVSKTKKYKEFSIHRKSRIISAPATALKILQRKLSQVLYSVYEPKATVHGFSPGRSIVTNAEQHLHKRFVLNIDLQDFFNSIHFGRVRGVFIAPPYNCTKEVATVLAQICCYSNKLPQGAPTSPVISNMICARMDSQLRLLAKDYRCTYTRYADDITFSTNLTNLPKQLVLENTSESISKIILGEKLVSIIQDNGFAINESKTRLQHKSQRQEVTGLTVNQFPNVKREYIRKISSMLQAWDKFGLESAQQKYVEMRSQEFEVSQEKIPPFEEVLRGKINFLGMVRGKDNEIYRKYRNWYRLLSKR